MRIGIIFALVVLLGCQSQNKNKDNTKKTAEVVQSPGTSKSAGDTQQEKLQCNEEICLQLRNHDGSKKSFEIYM